MTALYFSVLLLDELLQRYIDEAQPYPLWLKHRFDFDGIRFLPNVFQWRSVLACIIQQGGSCLYIMISHGLVQALWRWHGLVV